LVIVFLNKTLKQIFLMRIALLLPNNSRLAPYLRYYTNIFEKEKLAYDIIKWNRTGLDEEDEFTFKNVRNHNSPLNKVINYREFRDFIESKLNKRTYQKIVVFSCQLGVLLYSFLERNYKNKYVLDIRDYSSFTFLFRKKFIALINNSNSVFISSHGFRNWLPPNKPYIISHNIDLKMIKKNQTKCYSETEEVYQVDTIGAIRDYNSNFKLVKSLKNHKKFTMSFIGYGYAIPLLKKTVSEKRIKNVSFLGAYEKENEVNFLKNTDFINIIQDKNKESNCATANRLYLSAILQIPCIVRNNTEHGRLVKKYKLGVIIDNYKNLSNSLLNFKQGNNEKQFIRNCEIFLKEVKNDYLKFENAVINFIAEK